MTTAVKPKVLILKTQRSELADHIPEYEEFTNLFNIVIEEVSTKESLFEKFEKEFTDIEGIWVTGPSFHSLGGLSQFIDSFPSTLKVIAYPWVGYFIEDAERLKAKGIIYCNVGNVSADDVADSALHLALSAYRFTSFFEHQLRTVKSVVPAREIIGSESFDLETHEPTPSPKTANLSKSTSIGGKKIESPTGKTVGIVGLGSIGSAIGKRLSAIGMKISYTKRKQLSKEEESILGYDVDYYPTFKELIPHVDLIVLAVPESAHTKHLINSETIKLVKKGVRIVNIGRGSAIDENVLFKALDDGTVTSVGLDVFENELNVDARYHTRWDVTITPHIGNITTDDVVGANIRCMENIRNVLLENGPGISPIV